MSIKYFDITSVSISDKVIPMFSFNGALSGQLWAALPILKVWPGVVTRPTLPRQLDICIN
jgi:hypothetical protein